MNSTKPVCKKGITGKDIGGEILLYDLDGDAIHTLNPTAQVIWELCDGEHSVEDMRRSIKASFRVDDNHDVSEDIRRTLEHFQAKGLLQDLT